MNGTTVGESPPLLEVRGLQKHYPTRTGRLSGSKSVVRAVDGVSFSIGEGETLGLVGESGCGKSTLARTLLFLENPTDGQIFFQGRALGEEQAFRLRSSAQIVFQDPYLSLPPRMRVGAILADPLLIHGIADKKHVKRHVGQLLRDVGLSADIAGKLPHELSGGQRQRVGIARALSVQPSLIVADEAVSSLDASVRSQILNLMKDVQARRGLSYLFISHDLGIVKYMSHRIAVMYLGKIVEVGPADQVYGRPLHPYTKALLSATPSLRRGSGKRIRLEGEPPDPSKPPPGCTFHPRCPIAQSMCQQIVPELEEWLPGRLASCHYAMSEVNREPA